MTKTQWPTICVAGRKIRLNSRPWTVNTNRHTTTAGRDWGWIEGCENQECWSNDIGSDFTRNDANEAILLQRQWIEKHKPYDVKLCDAHRALEDAKKSYQYRLDSYESAKDALNKATAVLDELHADQVEVS